MKKRPALSKAGGAPPVTEAEWPEDLRVVNCARCDRVMRARDNTVEGFEHLPLMHARVYGRAVCAVCYPAAVKEPRPPETLYRMPNPE